MINDKEIEQPQEKLPDLPKELNDAFDAFFHIDPSATMMDRFDALAHAIIAFRFHLLDRHRRTGKKKVNEEEVFLFECNEQLKAMEKVILSAKKLGRLVESKPPEQFESGLLGKIISMKGSVGDIVQKVPVEKKEVPGA